MQKKLPKYSGLLIILFLILILATFTKKLLALDCENISDTKQKVECLSNKLNQLNQTKNTLNSQITFMDTQISLTTARIQETENEIETTQKEIDTLGSRIEGLDTSLDYLSKLLLNRIVEEYKQHAVSIFDVVLDAGNAGELVDKFKYIKTAQQNSQKLLVQVQMTKTNFEDQKKLREEKVKQLDDLKITLASQKSDLEGQKQAKKNLLAATNNDEATYQSLLEKAQRELAGFSAFAQSAGGGLTTFGNGSNGWYYTQRDPAWGNMLLPGSSSSVLMAGCAVTSVAMVCKSYGQGISPASIAGNSANFIGGDLWNWAFNCSGKSSSWIGASQDEVKSYVKNNTPVILRLVAPSVSGLHFIVAFAWDDGKNDFKIHDPFYGPDKYFSEKYSWGQVSNAVVIH